MRLKTLLIALFVISIAALGGVLWRNNTQLVAVASVEPPKPMILVSANPLRTGTLLRPDDLKWLVWNEASPPGSVLRPSEDQRRADGEADLKAVKGIYGAVLRQRMDAGQPLLTTNIVKPGDRGFLAAVLQPGYRAVAIGVTAISSAAGLIYPGDHVDVILTQKFQNGEAPLSRRSVGETIVANLRVLAMDQKLQEVSADPNDTGGAPGFARTVTLEVLPRQAEMITVASELGKLSLSLRSVPTGPEAVPTTDTQVAETNASTWADDVSPALKIPAPSGKTVKPVEPVVRIMRGSKIEAVKD